MQIGRADVLERKYMEKFRTLAANFGEFVAYERDRAARDIGLAFTRPKKSGGEVVTNVLRWFQLKGIASTTLTEAKLATSGSIKIRLELAHLKFWYLAPEPTFLVVYAEAVDRFFVTNIQRAVERKWGRSVLIETKKSATVEVPLSSPLDDTAMRQILSAGESDHWQRVFGFSASEARLAVRDAGLVLAVEQAIDSGGSALVTITEWISKMRTEVAFRVDLPNGERRILRDQWGFRSDIEAMFPHFSFSPAQTECWFFEDGEHGDVIELSSGERVFGVECMGEHVQYHLTIELAELGIRIASAAKELEKAGVISFLEKQEFVSIAPWDQRDV